MKQLTMTKVLTPLAALAFAFGVQAATISDGFETETSTVVTNRTGWSFTYGSDGADDASAITAYGEAAKPASLPDAFATAGDNFLKLSTEDGMLFRELGTSGKSIGVEGLFVDTDVQFTITDPSDRPEVTADDKFIIWLEDQGASGTNLCVWARKFTNMAATAFTSNVYTLVASDGSALNITPGAWYRLTVKALSSVGTGVTFPAFQVYLNGSPLKAYSGQYITTLENGEGEGTDYFDQFANSVGGTIVSDRFYFPAMASSLAALTKVGFSGEGAIDNISVTDDVPGNLPHHKLTISWDTTVLNAVTLKNADDVTVATLTSSGDSVSVDAATVLHFAKADLGFINPSAADSYDFKGVDNEAWSKTGYATLALANNVVTIAAADGDGSFTIALDRNTAAVATIVLPANVRTAIDSVTYTVGGSSTTITAESYNDDEQVDDYYFDVGQIPVNIEIGQTITVSVATKTGYSATIAGTAGVTGTAALGFEVTDNVATITISAISTAATVDGVAYESFADALTAATTAGTATITLAKNATVGDAAIASGKNITIDLAGNTITGDSGAAAVFAVADGGTLTITNSTETIGAVVYGSAAKCITNAGILNIQAGNFSGAIESGAYVTGGAFDTIPAGATCPADKTIGTIAESGYVYGLVDAVAAIDGTKYTSFKAAIDAAAAGQTVVVLADCTVTEPVVFNYGITVSNDYTVSINTYYALRIANGTSTPVTFCGTGSYVWTGGSGSPILVGCNEVKAANAGQGDPTGITSFYAGSFVLNGNTLTSTDATAKGGNLVKLEDGTFVLNSGTLNGGTRGVKADSEGNDATCVLTINGGTIVNTNSAAIAASTAGSGSSTVTVNAGTFTGAITGAGMVTIPGGSTAQFDRDQTTFCAAGYETVLSGGWYVVQAIPTYTISYLNADGTEFTDWAESYKAPMSYTKYDAVTLPTSSDVDLQVVGVTFGGWTNGTGTVTGWAAGQTGNVTVYAKLDPVVAPAGWVDDSSTIDPGTTAAEQYSDLDGTALASADAKELTDWAEAKSIDYAAVVAAPGDYVEAFLLNCAVADVATEKAAFKANITVNADGTVTVTAPDGKDYNGTLQLKGKAALTDAEWTDVSTPSSSYKFYKYELSL